MTPEGAPPPTGRTDIEGEAAQARVAHLQSSTQAASPLQQRLAVDGLFQEEIDAADSAKGGGKGKPANSGERTSPYAATS